MHRHWRWILGLGAILVVLPVAGVPLAWAAQDVNVELKDFEIAPAQMTVRAGEPVRLLVRNTGPQFPHNLRVGTLDIQLRDNLQPGQSGAMDLEFTRPGSYDIWCPVGTHKDRGMVGKLTVVAAGAALPAQLPRSGDELTPYLLGIAGLALALVALGARLRRSDRPTA